VTCLLISYVQHLSLTLTLSLDARIFGAPTSLSCLGQVGVGITPNDHLRDSSTVILADLLRAKLTQSLQQEEGRPEMPNPYRRNGVGDLKHKAPDPRCMHARVSHMLIVCLTFGLSLCGMHHRSPGYRIMESASTGLHLSGSSKKRQKWKDYDSPNASTFETLPCLSSQYSTRAGRLITTEQGSLHRATAECAAQSLHRHHFTRGWRDILSLGLQCERRHLQG